MFKRSLLRNSLRKPSQLSEYFKKKEDKKDPWVDINDYMKIEDAVDNTFIGHKAGFDYTGSDNIFIGYQYRKPGPKS